LEQPPEKNSGPEPRTGYAEAVRDDSGLREVRWISQLVGTGHWRTAASFGYCIHMIYGDDVTIMDILTTSGDIWAVVGLSSNPERAAYRVAEKLQRIGKKVVPVHPKAETVHGEQGYASLAEIPFPVDVVNVFVNSSLAGDIADQAVALGAKAVWFQLGVIDEAAYDRAREAGLQMVMDRSAGREITRLELG
jgi:predicted CoA-binding protein